MSGDRIDIDDPYGSASDEERKRWWDEAMSSRLNNPDAKVVVIMARQHNEDIPGHLVLTDLPYEHLVIPTTGALMPNDGLPLISASHPIPSWPKRVWFWVQNLFGYPKLSEDALEDAEIDVNQTQPSDAPKRGLRITR